MPVARFALSPLTVMYFSFLTLNLVQSPQQKWSSTPKTQIFLPVHLKEEREQAGLPNTQSPGWTGLVNLCSPEASMSTDWHVQT